MMRLISNHTYKELKKLKADIRELRYDYEHLEERHNQEMRRVKRQHALADEELSALREMKLKSLSQLKKGIELESKEALLKAKNDEFESIAKELAKASEKAEKAREEGKKEGYADGVADGLREATKITAEDRKMMGQVAALAAASHQGDATKSIADAIAKDIHRALPATTKKQ